MPKEKREGVTGVYVEYPDELLAALDELVARLPLGNRADHMRLALARHLDSPPTVAVPALPAVEKPAEEPKPARGRPRKS